MGAGKTTLLNRFIDDLDQDVLLARIDQTQLSERELLEAILVALGEEPDSRGKVSVMQQLREFLLEQAEQERRVIIAIDEAQCLGYKSLEEVRLLSGIELHQMKVASLILMGQPELDRLISSPELEQLAQRVRLRFHLGALSAEDSRHYLAHRIAIAGCDRTDLFADDAFPVIQRYAGGIPRLINSLCDMALLTAYVDEQNQVTAGVVEAAANELGWVPYNERAHRSATQPTHLHRSDPPGSELQHEIRALGLSLTEQIRGLRADLARVADALAARQTEEDHL
ncbi:MAG TPA: AAA family ATPase [Gammaproteobacteria bacterium]|nr:AAA family ATPase [Gammaproteobacteria bacterium]